MSAKIGLSYGERISNYFRQNALNGKGLCLTPRQRRRLIKKMNREDKLVQAEYRAMAVRIEEKSTRPCGGTDFCITKSGKRASRPHVKCQQSKAAA